MKSIFALKTVRRKSEREAMKMMMRQISRSESIGRTLKKKRAKKEKGR